jgi:hypothetical protein
MTRSAPKGFEGTTPNARFYRRTEGVPLWRQWRTELLRNEAFYLADASDPEMGRGLFARRDVSFAELRSHLYGWLCPITAADYEKLHAAGHPSLYQQGAGRYILCGPLSCPNHSCESQVGFARPHSFPVAGFETPTFAGEASDPSAKLLTLRDLRDDHEKNEIVFRQDEEVLLCYQDVFEGCCCLACKKRQKKKKKKKKRKTRQEVG